MKYLFLFLLCSLTTLAGLHAKIRIKTIVPVSAEGACDGSLLIEAAGEAGPFTVHLPEASLTYTEVNGTVLVSALCVGTYTVEVTTTTRFQCTKLLSAEIAVGFASLVGGEEGSPSPDRSDWSAAAAVETGERADFILYPNPTDGQLQVRLQGFQRAPVQLTIYAANGQQVHRFRDFRQHIHTIDLDLSALPAGTYFAVLQDQQGQTYTKQLVVRP